MNGSYRLALSSRTRGLFKLWKLLYKQCESISGRRQALISIRYCTMMRTRNVGAKPHYRACLQELEALLVVY